MNLKSDNYMKGVEFKERQFWLPFVDAVSIALQVMADVKQQAADWFRAWVRKFRTSRNVTLPEQQTFGVCLSLLGVKSIFCCKFDSVNLLPLSR